MNISQNHFTCQSLELLSARATVRKLFSFLRTVAVMLKEIKSRSWRTGPKLWEPFACINCNFHKIPKSPFVKDADGSAGIPHSSFFPSTRISVKHGHSVNTEES